VFSENKLGLRISTLFGIKIDLSDDSKNAHDSTRVNREGDSNEIDESECQPLKYCDPRISTLLGINIDSSDENENTLDSIRVNHEGDSNQIDKRDLVSEKYFDPKNLNIRTYFNRR
jgi:hypothetical protein